MKILYATSDSASDPLLWSGIVSNCLKALRDAGAEVVVFDQIPFECPLWLRLWHQILKRVSKKVHFLQIEPAILKSAARRIERKFLETNCDAVFCPGIGVPAFAFLPATIPVFTYHDATKLSWVRSYFGMNSLCARSQRHVEIVDRASLANNRITFFASDWAVAEAVSDYGVPRDRMVVVPFGANLLQPPSLPEVEAAITARSTTEIRFLFLGKDWERKGGPDAVALVAELRAQGIHAQLDVVGCRPEGVSSSSGVKVHGFIDHSKKEGMEQLRALMIQSHFVVLLSEAEAFGIALCESAAFGVPAIAANTGGIPTIVSNGVNGWLADLPFSATATATAVAEIVRQPASYRAMALAARRDYETRLNWVEAGRHLVRVIEQSIAQTPRPSRVQPKTVSAAASSVIL